MKLRTRLSVSFGIVFLAGAIPFAVEAVFVKDPWLLGGGGTLASALVLLGFFLLGHRFEPRLTGVRRHPTLSADAAPAIKESTPAVSPAEPEAQWASAPAAAPIPPVSTHTSALEAAWSEFARLIHDSITSARAMASRMEEQKRAVEAASQSIGTRMKSIEAISAGIEQQSAAVSQLSGTIEEMTTSIRNVAAVGRKAGDIAETLSRRAESGGSAVSTAMDSIRTVNGFSEQIAEIVTMITDISSQTSLLSMNAAIEAAHAGDAGKGFAVVAAEIRKLAVNAADSAKQISRLVKSVVRTIGEASTTGLQAMSRFTEIRDDVLQTRSVVAEISGATTEQSKGAEEILKAAVSLVEVSEQVRSAVGEQRAVAGDAERVISDLREIAHKAGEMAAAADTTRFPMLDALSRLGRVCSTEWDAARGTWE